MVRDRPAVEVPAARGNLVAIQARKRASLARPRLHFLGARAGRGDERRKGGHDDGGDTHGERTGGGVVWLEVGEAGAVCGNWDLGKSAVLV